MKNNRFIRACAALAVAVACLCIASASAQGSQISYEGGAEGFIFVPENADLFESFKGVMPGDELFEQITIKNDASKQVKVNLYLSARAVDEKYRDFLDQFTLSVKQGDRTLFAAPAGAQEGLSQNVLLGTFYSGAQTQLEVTLHAPAGLPDDYQDGYGEIEWVFTAEELPVSPDDPTPPSSGGPEYMVYAFCALGSALGVCAVILGRVRRRGTPE